MVDITRKGLALFLKWGLNYIKSEAATEEPEQADEPEPPSTDPEAKPMPAYWETDIKQLGDRNQEFIDLYRKGKALESVPGTTEGKFKESYYKYQNLPIYKYSEESRNKLKDNSIPTIHQNNNLYDVPEPPKAGTGISSSGRDAGVVAGIVIAVITGIIILAALIAVVMYKHYVHRNVTSMNFDNPVYRKTTEDQFALEKNGYAPGSKLYPSTVGEEAQEPLNTPGTNEFV